MSWGSVSKRQAHAWDVAQRCDCGGYGGLKAAWIRLALRNACEIFFYFRKVPLFLPYVYGHFTYLGL